MENMLLWQIRGTRIIQRPICTDISTYVVSSSPSTTQYTNKIPDVSLTHLSQRYTWGQHSLTSLTINSNNQVLFKLLCIWFSFSTRRNKFWLVKQFYYFVFHLYWISDPNHMENQNNISCAVGTRHGVSVRVIPPLNPVRSQQQYILDGVNLLV